MKVRQPSKLVAGGGEELSNRALFRATPINAKVNSNSQGLRRLPSRIVWTSKNQAERRRTTPRHPAGLQ